MPESDKKTGTWIIWTLWAVPAVCMVAGVVLMVTQEDGKPWWYAGGVMVAAPVALSFLTSALDWTLSRLHPNPPFEVKAEDLISAAGELERLDCYDKSLLRAGTNKFFQSLKTTGGDSDNYWLNFIGPAAKNPDMPATMMGARLRTWVAGHPYSERLLDYLTDRAKAVRKRPSSPGRAPAMFTIAFSDEFVQASWVQFRERLVDAVDADSVDRTVEWVLLDSTPAYAATLASGVLNITHYMDKQSASDNDLCVEVEAEQPLARFYLDDIDQRLRNGRRIGGSSAAAPWAADRGRGQTHGDDGQGHDDEDDGDGRTGAGEVVA